MRKYFDVSNLAHISILCHTNREKAPARHHLLDWKQEDSSGDFIVVVRTSMMAGKKIPVDFYYAIISPYSWFGLEIMTRYASVWPIDLRLKPFNLGRVMAESKNKPPGLVRSKATYMFKDLNRLSSFYGVPLTIPKNFMEYIFQVDDQRQQMLFISAIDLMTNGQSTEAVSREFFKALFKDHIEMGKFPFKELAAKAGVDDETIAKSLSAIGSKEVEERLENNTTDALSLGAFGAPTTVAHTPSGPQLFFGSDRMEIMAHTLGFKYEGPLLCKNKL